MTKALMIQGAGSDVGKSTLVAGLCRAFARQGLRVRPFKPQNMSNNAAVTVDGGEIGRAQALQALAAGVEPHTDMNPVLLKPETETGSQIVVQGKRIATLKAREYGGLKSALLAPVLESFRRLAREADLILVEGAGSPAEVNLRAGDIANMGFARAVRTPVALVGDVDRGGVIAQMVGTQTVIADADAALIKGFAINKFRGDPALFEDGYRLIAEKTGWRGLGVIPWFAEARKLPAEDALGLKTKTVTGGGRVKIGCLTLSRIANFDDLDPLKLEPDVDLRMIGAGEAVPGDLDLVILPGSKSTRGDLVFLKRQGWDVDLRAHVRRGGRVLGICGGYQILGRMVRDPDGVEGPAGETEGLGLLDVVTEMSRDKRLTRRVAQHAGTGIDMKGYEIHIGRTEGADCARPFARIDGRAEGARSADGRVEGTYLHGVFSSDGFRAAYLRDLGARAGICYDAQIDAVLDRLAAHLEAHMPLAGVLSLMERID